MNKKPTEQSPEVQPAVAPPSIVQPIVDQLKNPHKIKKPDEKAPPTGPLTPPKPAELDQDAGGGYNPDHTIPQP